MTTQSDFPTNTKGDERFALCQVSAGNDTDAQFWAERLLAMYQSWAKRRHFEFRTIDVIFAEPIGLRSAIFTIEGHSAARLLASESGVHRLVDVSQFDPQARRTTSFATVRVTSLLDQPGDGHVGPIRSYVQAPYQLVKDLRTDYETGDTQAVLDGDLDAFMEAYQRKCESQA